MKSKSYFHPIAILLLVAAGLCPKLMASPAIATPLVDLSLEELMEIEVTTVSKKAQSLNRIPAAVFVITGDDIRRSGATNIPDLLRMVPGIHVGRIGSGIWAVSARGFNFQFANKLLVLLDGRTIYSPIFAGVFLG